MEWVLHFDPLMAPRLRRLILPMMNLLLVLGLIVQSVSSYGQTGELVVADLATDEISLVKRLEMILDPNTQEIDISTYILANDESGLLILAALRKAALRGVKIRLLIDNKIRDRRRTLQSYLAEFPIETRYYNPIRFNWKAFLFPFSSFRKFNHRMHDKIFIVRSRQSFKGILGDKNYVNKFFEHIAPKGQLTMRGKETYIEGAVLQEYQSVFDGLWQNSDKEKTRLLGPRDKYEMDVIFDGYDRLIETILKTKRDLKFESHRYSRAQVIANKEGKVTLHQIFDLISAAPPRSDIVIEASYFVLFPELENVIRETLAKGSKITVVVNDPAVSDQKMTMGSMLQIDLPRMLGMGLNVELITAPERISHAKLVLINDEIVINGSANFDPRSYSTNSESGLLIESRELNQKYRLRFAEEAYFRRVAVFAGRCRNSFIGRAKQIDVPTIWKHLIRPFRNQL